MQWSLRLNNQLIEKTTEKQQRKTKKAWEDTSDTSDTATDSDTDNNNLTIPNNQDTEESKMEFESLGKILSQPNINIEEKTDGIINQKGNLSISPQSLYKIP